MQKHGYIITIHWNRIIKKWSVHYKGKCHLIDELTIETPIVTVYKPNKKDNPKAWLKTKGYLIENKIVGEIS